MSFGLHEPMIVLLFERIAVRTCWGSMETTVIRYCPGCGARVKAPESVFEGPCICPTCHERTQFYDYPREVPAVPPQPATRPTTTWYDRLLWGALIVASLTALVVLWAFFNDRADAAIIGSATCLIAALAVAGHVVRLKRDMLRAAEAQKRAERALVVSNSKLQAASEIQRGFKQNFDKLVAEEKRRLQNSIAARQESTEVLHAEAVEQIKIVKTDNPGLKAISDRLLDEGVDRLSRHLNASNLPDCRRQLKELIQFCRENGCRINRARETDLMCWLEKNYQAMMLEVKHKNEQERVENKMQEEERVLRELEQHIRSAEAERSAVQKTLATVLKKTRGAKSEETEYLREKLDSAEKKTIEATDALNRPTSGYVYVLSNIGSFGRNMFKIGTTRRIDPGQHVKELGGEAVPFPYDIHMMIASENAADLEAALHEALHDFRVNRFNHCKDFFKIDIQTIWRLVVANHGTVDYVSESAAEEFEESRIMSDEAFQRMTELHRTPETYRDPFDAKD